MKGYSIQINLSDHPFISGTKIVRGLDKVWVVVNLQVFFTGVSFRIINYVYNIYDFWTYFSFPLYQCLFDEITFIFVEWSSGKWTKFDIPFRT